MSEDSVENNAGEKKKTLIEALDAFRPVFMEAMKAVEDRSESYWNSLTPEQQLDAFCAVVRRKYKGEIEKCGTYRYVLYDVFEFGPEAYAPAQMAGYLDLHNSIWSNEELEIMGADKEKLYASYGAKFKEAQKDGSGN